MNRTNSPTRVHIGQVIQNAVAFDFKRLSSLGNKHVMSLGSLLQSVDSLFDLLTERGIDYVLVGGIAMLQYVEGRNTEDIDLIMALNELKKVPEIQIEEQNAYFARGYFESLQIDLLLTDNKLFQHVRNEYVTDGHFVEHKIPCATVEGLILLKLYALPSLYSQGNFARVGIYENDVATLIQAYNPDMDKLLIELRNHLSKTDTEEVHDILIDIQKRLERFARNE
ncbi:MAG: hypothetical protein AAF702_08110 [Chloroflexota bacterium]